MKASRTLAERIARLHALQAGRCFYCARSLTLRSSRDSASPGDATIDHFIPLARGGAQGYRNWVLACAPCNQAKAHRLPTRDEMAHWNELAANCATMQQIDLDAEPKHCIACGDLINPLRLAASRQQGRETKTCRRGCRARTTRGQVDRQNKAALDGQGPVAKYAPKYAAKHAAKSAAPAQQPGWWQRIFDKAGAMAGR